MASSPTAFARLLVGALGVAALYAGMVVGASGCGLCIRPCPSGPPLEPGMYEIVVSPDRPELVGSLVDIADDRLEIRFADAEGNEWVVDYAIEP